MSRKDIPAEFATIEEHIRRAHVERAAYMGSLIAEGGAALGRAIKRLGAAMERGYAEELDRRAIEADAFLRRSVPRY
ncbi:MAG TPA: hypothetical protein VF038_06380 [Usitatibacter sp.]|jgi:hypothetical protein